MVGGRLAASTRIPRALLSRHRRSCKKFDRAPDRVRMLMARQLLLQINQGLLRHDN